jgi:hypothetical protein
MKPLTMTAGREEYLRKIMEGGVILLANERAEIIAEIDALRIHADSLRAAAERVSTTQRALREVSVGPGAGQMMKLFEESARDSLDALDKVLGV